MTTQTTNQMAAIRPLRPRIYVAGPIRKGSLLHNVQQADEAMGALMRAGFAPMNPMLSVYAGCAKAVGDQTVAVADPLAKLEGVTADDWLNMDLSWVAVAHGVLRLPGESVGADGEVDFANSLGIPCFDCLETLKLFFSDRVTKKGA